MGFVTCGFVGLYRTSRFLSFETCFSGVMGVPPEVLFGVFLGGLWLCGFLEG